MTAERVKPTVLCVDDEQVVRSSLKDQLKLHLRGVARVECVESGEAALEAVEELGDDIPVVISDQIMPGLKGDELLAIVHRLRPRTLTILLTGQASPAAVENARREANLYRYLTKPWDGDALREAVRDAIDAWYEDEE